MIKYLIIFSILCVGCHHTHNKVKSPTPLSTTPPALSILTTTNGTRFGITGAITGVHHAPTLFALTSTIDEALTQPVFSHLGHLMHDQGWLIVSLDLPCHGQEWRAGEPGELWGWSYRIDNGENIAKEFTDRAQDVLDYLIVRGYTDSGHIAVSGTSRGGFMALQFAAVDSRISSVITFAPVTELMRLLEFQGTVHQDWANAENISNLAPALIRQNQWMEIGYLDTRVGTDAAQAVWNLITLLGVNVTPLPSRYFLLSSVPGHYSDTIMHEMAAAWLSILTSQAAG